MLSRRRTPNEEGDYTTMAPRRTLPPTYEVIYRPARATRPHELLTRFVSADGGATGVVPEDSDSELSHVYELVGKRKPEGSDTSTPRASKIPRLSQETSHAPQPRNGPAKATAKPLGRSESPAGATQDAPEDMDWQASTSAEGAGQLHPDAHPWAQIVDAAVRKCNQ